ncbi:MAG: hypothetical protein JRH15_18755 [Deltaproteobacteria bacterium]|nr:hypothetical protein [Deltaproteobacteria bacterium]
MVSPMRLSKAIVEAAEKESEIQKRSVPKQIEHWAELGKIVERLLPLDDVFAIIQGFKKIIVEPVASTTAKANDVFDSLENSRQKGELAKKVTTPALYYEASLSRPGLIDRVDTATGRRQTGKFQIGEFKAQG